MLKKKVKLLGNILWVIGRILVFILDSYTLSMRTQPPEYFSKVFRYMVGFRNGKRNPDKEPY